MSQTKITLKIHKPFLKAFNKQVEDNFLKRDAFLNHVIKCEISHLQKDMGKLRQSDAARLYISRQIKELDLKTINVVVDKDVSVELKKIVDQTNMVRDAFANRLILFLLSPDQLLKHFELPFETNDYSLSSSEGMPTSPLKGIEAILYDPFYYLRTAYEEAYRESFYLLDLQSIDEKLIGLSCYISDKDVPGTADYEADDDLVPLLDL